MSFLNPFSELYSGRTYITRTPEELNLSWKALKMSSRVAWIEKQLAGWDIAERAIISCRNFHKLRPNLRTQALFNLQQWQKAEGILTGKDEEDQIELRIISASGLPKPTFWTPNTSVKVVSHIQNEPPPMPGSGRLAEEQMWATGGSDMVSKHWICRD
jgi:tryptophan 2,3-dioxygenase